MKRTLTEGGVRVPTLACGPKPSKIRTISIFISVTDNCSFEMAQIKPPKEIDISMLPTLSGETMKQNADTFTGIL